MFEVRKKMYFNDKDLGKKNTREKVLVILFQSPAVMVSGISTTFLAENQDELCDSLNLFLQGKQFGENSNITNEETVDIAAKLKEYKCISMKQHKFSLPNCLN